MSDQKLLEIKNLRVVYETDEAVAKAVNGVSLTLNKREVLGILGETGAGKTTTALSILRLLPQYTGKVTEGEILYNGKDLLKLSSGEMQAIRGEMISMIFQDPMSSLNPVMTVGDQIKEALFYHNESKYSSERIRQRVDEILELVGIPSARKNNYPHQFSGGMKQRIVIAIALACDPELLIADEPTTALDVTIQAQVLRMMKELKEKTGASMILITHDLGIVAKMCDNVAVMYAGEIIESGSVWDIFENKAHHPYTNGLFASLPNLNIDSKRLNPIGGLMPDPAHLPPGCKFHPRCPRRSDVCKIEAPEVFAMSPTHRIKCRLFGEKEDGLL